MRIPQKSKLEADFPLKVLTILLEFKNIHVPPERTVTVVRQQVMRPSLEQHFRSLRRSGQQRGKIEPRFHLAVRLTGTGAFRLVSLRHRPEFEKNAKKSGFEVDKSSKGLYSVRKQNDTRPDRLRAAETRPGVHPGGN